MTQDPFPDPDDSPNYDELTEEERTAIVERFVSLGCTPKDAELLIYAGIDPDLVGESAPDVVGFASAAVHHDLPDINWRLALAGGDPDWAWEMWAEERGGR